VRQLLNVVYALLTDSMSEDEQHDFDRQVSASPAEPPKPRSKGTGALMAAFGQQARK
jgi:hypothetical protein